MFCAIKHLVYSVSFFYHLDREQQCPAEFEWNAVLRKCDPCRPGYYGLNCSKSCASPYYGHGCQKECVDCDPSQCDVSRGCPIHTEPQISTKTTFIQTTEKRSTSASTAEISIAFTKSKSSSSEVNLSKHHVPTTSQTETTKFHMFASTSSTPSFFDSYYPILLGIFGVCSLFLIIFTIYVSIHVYSKCSKRRKSKLQQKESVEHSEVYQEINELDTVGEITKYDPLNRTKPMPNRGYQAVVSSSPLQAATSSFSTENINEYSEIKDKDQRFIQSQGTGPPIYEKESRYTSSPTSLRTPNRTECQQKIEINRKSPPRDADDYVLPTSEGPRKDMSSGSNPCTSQLTSDEAPSDSNETTDGYNTINDDTVNEYLTVIPN